MKVFPNKQKLKEFVTTKPVLQEILGGSCETKYQRHRYKHETNRHQNDSKPISFYNNTERNGLNAPSKRHKVWEWIKKQDPSICCLQETHFSPEDTFRWKVRRWRTIYHATGSQNKAGVAILTSDKLDFKLKAVTRDEEGHHIIVQGLSIRKS